MYTSSLKPFVINGTDITFLLDQVRFRPLFDANHNAIINWDGTTSIYDGYGNLLYSPPVGQTAGSAGALADIAQWGTSYQTVVDLTGIRDPSGANNNLAGVNWTWGTTDYLFLRMTGVDYTKYASSATASSRVFDATNPNSITSQMVTGPTGSSAYAITAGTSSAYTGKASDGTYIIENNVVDGSARTISRLTTTGGVTFDIWANHAGDPGAANHTANEIYYDANGVATVTNWGQIGAATATNPDGLGQYDTQARFMGSAGAGATGSLSAGADATQGDQYIGGLNPGVAPSNGFFVLFGQFFDHGLDFIGKGEQGKTIKITLDPTDPLYGMIGPDGQPTHSITINRANVATLDANGNPQYADHTSPFIDQSQTYGSHSQLTTLLREWVLDPASGTYKAGMNMLDGHTLQTAWKNAAGDMVTDTLPTLNELRAHIEATGRDAITWEDVLNLRNRDASGHVIAGTSESPLLLDSNPRFDEQHLHGYHDYNNNGVADAGESSANAAQVTAVDNAIASLDAKVKADYGANSFLQIDATTHKLTLHLENPPAFWTGMGMPSTVDGAAALSLWVDFGSFNIMDVPTQTIMTTGAVHDAVSEILMASVGDHYIAGDGRVNENFGLTSIHHVFHEEHNFQVDNLIAALHRDAIATGDQTNLHSYQIDTNGGTTNANGDYVNGSGQVTWDLEKMFQATKLIVEMEYQHAAVDQYARNVTPNIQEFVGYSPDKNPGLTMEYSQVAFRFGHSTLRETIDTIDPSHGLTGKIMGYALEQAFLNPDAFAKVGPSATLLGMTHQQMNSIDEFVTPALNQGLLGQPLDLAAINIARGRDVGMPALNDMRSALGLAKYTSWDDFGNNMEHPTSLVNFIAAYSFNGDADAEAKAHAIVGLADGTILDGDAAAMGYTSAEAVAFLSNDATLADTNPTLAGKMADFNQIDSWLGGLAEVHQPGGLLGETFDLIFVTQIESLMDGDRFYYLYRLAGQQFGQEVINVQLKDLVERNTGLTHLNGNVFGYADKYYDFGANREVTDGTHETATTSNNHKYGDVVDSLGNAVTAGAEASKLGAHSGIGALTWNNDLTNSSAANNFMNSGAGVGIYTNSGRSSALDGSIMKIGGVAYVRDTRMVDTGQDTGAATLNGGTNLDGTPNSGADSNEVIVGTKWGDMIYAQGGDDTVYGEGGNDKIYGGYGIDRLYGGDGSDTIYGGDNPDLIDGGSGDDFLYGESSGTDINGNDQVIGGSGNDFISGGTGIDKLSGGTGDDHIMGDQDTDPFTHGDDGNDWVEGNSGGDILYGDNGDDLLEGGADQDQMFGGKGDDIIRPGDATGALTIGTDEVLGGDGVTDEGTLPGTRGFDLIDFSDNTIRPGGIKFDIGNQANPATAVNGIPTQVPSWQIEGVIGSAAGDTLTGDNTDGIAGWVVGANGDDTLQGGSGDDIIIGDSMRLDDIIGQYHSGYNHNNDNAGLTEADQLQDARYQGASHRVLYSETIDTTGLIDAINGQTGGSDFEKHFTEMLRSDQFKNLVLGNSDAAGVASANGGNDTVVFQGNKADYTLELVTFTDHAGHVHSGLRVTDSVAGRDGSDAVIDVTNFKFADGTFTFDQLLPPPAASVGNASVTEGNSGTVNASFTITLSHAAATDVTVNYSTSDGTAMAPGDFTSTTGSVVIPAGQTSAVITVPVVGDTTYEANETFSLNLLSANNGVTIGNGVGTGTIINDDAQPSLSIGNANVTEGDAGTKIVTFTVNQSAASGTATTVHWATANGTATAGSDYVAGSGDLTIAAGATSATFSVTVNGDTVIEGDETFSVSLSAPTNATIATGTATGTIINDDLNIVYNAARQSGAVFPGGASPAVAMIASNPGSNALAVTGWTNPAGDTATYSMSGATLNRSAEFADNQTYTVNLSATTATGGVEQKTVTIKTGSDAATQTLAGVAGSDTVLYGKGGTDHLSGNTGNDWIDGGAGNDDVTMAGSRYNYNWDLTSGLAANVNNFPVLTDMVGNQGTDTLVAIEQIIFSDGTFGFNNAGNFNPNIVLGNAGNNALNGGGGDDIVVGGMGNDTITYSVDNLNFSSVNVANSGGRDLIFGGAGTDTFILNGNGSTEDFYIYSRDAYLAANPGVTIGAATGIVITRSLGSSAPQTIVAELNSIEEIKINTTGTQNASNLNGTGINTTGTGASGDHIHVIGDFTNTGLAYNTITVNGGAGADQVDISGLSSAHRVVFNTGGGADTVVGDLRPQDVINGALGGSAAQTVEPASMTPQAVTLEDLLSGTARNPSALAEVYNDHHGGWLGGMDNSHHFLV